MRKKRSPITLDAPDGMYANTVGIVVNTSPNPPLEISETGTSRLCARNPMNMKMGNPHVNDANAFAAVTTVALYTIGAFLFKSLPYDCITPMATESPKNNCPIASIHTSLLPSCAQSGVKYSVKPFPAPGNVAP